MSDVNDQAPPSGSGSGTVPPSVDSNESTDVGSVSDSQDVVRVHVGEREFILVGTAHISRESAELVERVVAEVAPDRVCIELDERRFEALKRQDRFESLDLKEVIRQRQLPTLILNLVLASYQKQLGAKLGVQPGTELMTAAATAEEQGIPVSLSDRDVQVTMRRAWGSLEWWRKWQLVGGLFGSLFESRELDEEELRELRQKDVLSSLMEEIGEAFPRLKASLIDERDDYLAEMIRRSEGDRVVGVVGAGHLAGIQKALEEGREVDLERLDEVPEGSGVWKWVGWGIPMLIIAALGYIGISKGPAAAGDSALFWVLANGIPSAIGAIVALAHPATMLTAFVAAPITSLSPLIGAGYVAAFVQAWTQPPRVHELKTVSEEIRTVSAWWRNRLLRVFMVFVLTSLGSALGTFVGGFEIFSNLM